MADFSDYIIFADESGDHGLERIDPSFPVFALVFCMFHKESYAREVEPAFRELKFKYFGHDCVILHEREIRKQAGDFSVLRNPAIREAFMNDVSALMERLPFEGYASIIKKENLRKQYADPWNPYEIAMQFCMEKVSNRLVRHGQKGNKAHILFEARGKTEDMQLELEFRRVADNRKKWGWRQVDFSRVPMEPLFVPKAANLAGHQLTDLIARPLALQAIRPEQQNRAFDTIKDRMNDIKHFP